jgi:hypothetical protein
MVDRHKIDWIGSRFNFNKSCGVLLELLARTEGKPIDITICDEQELSRAKERIAQLEKALNKVNAIVTDLFDSDFSVVYTDDLDNWQSEHSALLAELKKSAIVSTKN